MSPQTEDDIDQGTLLLKRLLHKTEQPFTGTETPDQLVYALITLTQIVTALTTTLNNTPTALDETLNQIAQHTKNATL